jgi:hypothetical protein
MRVGCMWREKWRHMKVVILASVEKHVPLCLAYIENVNQSHIDNMLKYIDTEEPHFLLHQKIIEADDRAGERQRVHACSMLNAQHRGKE